MNIFGNFFKGFDGNSFKAIGSLMTNNLKKQVFVWVIVAMTLVGTVIGAGFLWFMNLVTGGEIPESLIFDSLNSVLLTATMLPLSMITIFSIPSIMNSIHKSTMIKRIGATKISEQAFVLMTWVIFFAFAVLFTTIVYFGLLTMFFIFFGGGVVDSWLVIYLYTLLTIVLYVSLGVLLGTLSIGSVSSTLLSVFVLGMTLLVGGSMEMVTNMFVAIFPRIAILIILLNPLALASYGISSLFAGTVSMTFILVTVIYTMMVSAVFFLWASKKMSFNKIR